MLYGMALCSFAALLLELALTRARADRDAARSPAHRRMLDQAVAALEAELQRIK
jgi:RNA polymerase-interacting CarD/CdnL/TRCF family regulator